MARNSNGSSRQVVAAAAVALGHLLGTHPRASCFSYIVDLLLLEAQ